MQLRMWTYDIAREQSPSLDVLRRMCDLTGASGYNAVGLYLEHRFAYPSATWAHGVGCVTPEMVRILQEEYKELQIVPCINLLGHMEGFIYTEGGYPFAEERFKGMQADPTNERFLAFAHTLLQETLEIFTSHLIHIGGDETWQLGVGKRSQQRVAEYESSATTTSSAPSQLGGEGVDGKALLYGNHFGPLARKVVEAGRIPAVWGDMYFEHPQALSLMPRETVIFDWQYFRSPEFTSRRFLEAGYPVVFCPAIHTYNAPWCHLPQSERNVVEHAEAAERLGAYGVCVTTWECGLFGNYETLVPAIRASGRILADPPKTKKQRWHQTTALYTDPRGDYNPEEDEPTVHSGLATTILTSFLTEGHERIEMVPNEELCVFYAIPGRGEVGNIPIFQWPQVASNLCLRAGMDLMRKQQGQKGLITGRLGGKPFDLRLESAPTPYGMALALSFGQSHDPGYPLVGQGGAEAVAAYALSTEAPIFLRSYLEEGNAYGDWARLMGVEVQAVGGQFAFGGIRSALKCRLLLYSNPFLLWLHHREELCGEVGTRALEVAERASQAAPDVSTRGVTQLLVKAIEFVRLTEDAHQAYARGDIGECLTSLAPLRQIFDDLERVAVATNLNIGGSLADVERCRTAKEHVERVVRRVRSYGDGSLGYLPSFEYLTHPKFVAHDQAAWWLINRWANE